MWMLVLFAVIHLFFFLFFFFKQKTAYEMRISDWSSDVCSSDLEPQGEIVPDAHVTELFGIDDAQPRRRLRAKYLGQLIGRPGRAEGEIGRASCRERVCQYV